MTNPTTPDPDGQHPQQEEISSQIEAVDSQSDSGYTDSSDSAPNPATPPIIGKSLGNNYYSWDTKDWRTYATVTPSQVAHQVLREFADSLIIVETKSSDSVSRQILSLPHGRSASDCIWREDSQQIRNKIEMSISGHITFFKVIMEEYISEQANKEKDAKKSNDISKLLRKSQQAVESALKLKTKLYFLNEVMEKMITVALHLKATNQPIENLQIKDQSEINADMRYLGAPNGVIDLHTGELLQGEKAASKIVTASITDPYNPDAKHDLLKYMYDGAGVDNVKEYVRQELAFSLFGVPSKRIIFFLGATNSGKSALMSLSVASLGDYGKFMHTATLAKQPGKGTNVPSQHLYNLTAPVRIAVGDEQENVNFDAALMKQYSSGSFVDMRKMFENGGNRKITATMIVMANELPNTGIKLRDSAIKNRIRLVEFLKLDKMNSFLDDSLMSNPDHQTLRQAFLVDLIKCFRDNFIVEGKPRLFKPRTPLNVQTYMQEIEEEDQRAIDRWFEEYIIPDANSQFTSDALFSELSNTYQPSSDHTIKIQGTTYKRDTISAEMSKRLGMKTKNITVIIAGKKMKLRGWRGYKLLTQDGVFKRREVR